MLIKIIFAIFSVIIFLFLFWKRLKRDYEDDKIFTVSFYVLFGMLLGYLLSVYIAYDWWFWSAFFGSLTGLSIGIYRFKLRVFEVIESWAFSSLALLGLTFLYDWYANINVFSGYALLIISVLLFGFFFLDRHYKNFSWYRSGRIGFSGVTILGLFFIIRAAVATTSVGVVSFVGKSDAIVSSAFAFLAFLALFNLARKA